MQKVLTCEILWVFFGSPLSLTRRRRCVDSYLWILSTWKGTVLHTTQSGATSPHIALLQPLPFLYNLSLIHP